MQIHIDDPKLKSDTISANLTHAWLCINNDISYTYNYVPDFFVHRDDTFWVDYECGLDVVDESHQWW